MNDVPLMLKYGNIKPRGFATKYRRWEVNPQSSFNSFSPSELVRFNLQTDAWIDPYQSYLSIDVETSVSLMSNGLATDAEDIAHLELDGPSTSLIQTMILYSDSKEIERIDEYDQLGQLLVDLGMDVLNRSSKSYEGMGYEGALSNQAPILQRAGPNGYVFAENESLFDDLRVGSPGYNPTMIIPAIRKEVKLTGGFNVNENVVYRAMPWAYQRLTGVAPNEQPGTQTGQPVVQGTDIYDTEYGIDHYETLVSGYLTGVSAVMDTPPTTVGIHSARAQGYTIPFSTALSTNKSVYLTDNIKALKIVDGKFIRTPLEVLTNDTTRRQSIQKRTFIVPLLSGVLGILIPRDQWKLIPGRALKNIMFEFRLNPYAFFTSGKYFNVSTTIPQKRAWKISNFQMIFDLWSFEENVERMMDQALQGEGLILSSNSWTLGPIYQILGNGTATNNWQINNGIESVKALLFWFLSNDYLQYPFCRKNFRLSLNLTQYQLKIGAEFIPPYPIKGHAGNIAMNQVIKEDNTEFVQELHRTFGFFFAANKRCNINQLNFAVNERTYDPSTAETNNNLMKVGQSVPLFEERRCVGKALYAINLDSNPNDPDVLSGLNTTQKRPIELIVKANDTNKFPRDSTMFVMLNHDFYVQFTLQGTKTYGSG